jgi:hypothetical protein
LLDNALALLVDLLPPRAAARLAHKRRRAVYDLVCFVFLSLIVYFLCFCVCLFFCNELQMCSASVNSSAAAKRRATLLPNAADVLLADSNVYICVCLFMQSIQLIYLFYLQA